LVRSPCRRVQSGDHLKKNSNKRSRPIGSKKSKQMKTDMEIIQKITGNTKAMKKKDKDNKKHRKAQQNFMSNASSGMSALVSVNRMMQSYLSTCL
jgi:seryl-tRNA synthetase